jgi:hypothetical protein
MSAFTSGPDLFNRLADEFADRYRRGERPPLSEYTDKYPELGDQIRELFPALVAIEQFGTGADEPNGPRSAQPETTPPIPERLGDYRILREIARGGMGIVYEAVQESLGRHVALKVLPHHRLSDPSQLERFRREARAAALLHHTNIVPVFGVGECDGVHHYAMQYIQGQSLDDVLSEVRRLRGVKPGEPARSDASIPRQPPTSRAPARPPPPRRSWASRAPSTTGVWPGSASRRPRRSRMRISTRCCTATSSRRTCCWTSRGRSG